MFVIFLIRHKTRQKTALYVIKNRGEILLDIYYNRYLRDIRSQKMKHTKLSFDEYPASCSRSFSQSEKGNILISERQGNPYNLPLKVNIRKVVHFTE